MQAGSFLRGGVRSKNVSSFVICYLPEGTPIELCSIVVSGYYLLDETSKRLLGVGVTV
jgi:hypothetical protein